MYLYGGYLPKWWLYIYPVSITLDKYAQVVAIYLYGGYLLDVFG